MAAMASSWRMNLARYPLARTFGSTFCDPRDAIRQALTKLRAWSGIAITLAADDHEGQQLAGLIQSADILIDAVLGIGARLPLTRRRRRGCWNGQTYACSQRAARSVHFGDRLPQRRSTATQAKPTNLLLLRTLTITFIAAKRGHFTFPAARYVGALEIASLSASLSVCPNWIR